MFSRILILGIGVVDLQKGANNINSMEVKLSAEYS